jgi:predicted nucleotidyltransferase
VTGDRGSTFDVAACRAYLQARREQQHQVAEQRRQAVIQTVRAAVGMVLPRFSRVQRAYLFGSALRPAALRTKSDVDVAIEGTLDAEEYFALWRELERAAAGWPIDLVELDDDLPFAARVREKGELIYERRYPDAQSGDSRRSEQH